MHQYRHSEDTHPVPSILYRKKHDGKLLKYDVLKEIGKGGFGIVFSAIESPSKKKVALKCTPKCRLKKPKIKQKLINEMTIHKSLDHPNIVKFLGTFHDEYYIYFILELCEGGNVLEYIKNFNSNQNKKGVKNFYRMPSNRDPHSFNNQFNLQYLPEFEVIKITKQILKALDYLHSVANVIHRDIKLQNFLLTKNGIVKLSDFGLSINYEDVTDKASIVSICGTPNYISPEVIDRSSHTFAVDIWAVGVIVFLMLTGQRPFKSINNKKTFEKIRQVHYDWPIWPAVSEQAKSFVDSILKKNPLERPSAQKLLKHPFLCMKDDKTNKKSNSSDSSIKFMVPSNNNNSSHTSTSAYASTSNSNNTSIRSSSNQSTAPSINSQSNSNHSPYLTQKPQYFTLSPSPNYFQNNSKNMNSSSQNKKSQSSPLNAQNRSKSVTNTKNPPLNHSPPSPSNLINNTSSGILTSQHKQNRSLSPMRANNVKSDLFLSPHRTNYESNNYMNARSSYYSPTRVGRYGSRMISHIIIPDDHFLDLNESMRPNEQDKLNPNDSNEKNEDFKVEKSASIIIKATIETIEDAAKQAEKMQKSQKINQNSIKPNEKQKVVSKSATQKTPSGDNLKQKPDETVKEQPIVQLAQNKEDINNLDYHIDFGIIPSSHSKAFPKSSVLLWWDYSSRYGLGYILYNGCVGVCFNDLSRIIMEPTERYAQFYSRPHSKMEIVKLGDYENESDQPESNNDIESNENNNQKSTENESNISLPNKKKILILKHFAKNLKKIALKHIDSNIINFHEEESSLLENVTSKQLEYVKYWGTNKKDGILFRMNGKSLQASFTDKTSLYVCSDTKIVIFDDSKAISKVPLRDLVSNKKADSPIQSKFLIVKELGKNLE